MKTSRLFVPATVVAVAAALLAPPASGAAPARHHAPPGPQVVATGLDNPRQLTFDSGTLYVAEAGRGGVGPCIAGAEGPTCFGMSGAVTRVRGGHQSRVLQGLPSLAAADGTRAIGVSQVVPGRHGTLTMVIGLGNNPAVRSQLPASGALLGTLSSARTRGWSGHKAKSRVRVLADLAGYEATHDPDGNGPDSNPVALTRTRYGWVVADAGANAVMGVSWWGGIRPLTVLDSPGTATAPFPPFPEIPVQPVPTAAVQGPDGAWYVGELTGFPFKPGLSRIHRIDRHGHRTVWATGLTNVTDLAWYRGKLYAVQMVDDGLLAPEGSTGSLVRVSHGATHRTVVDNLVMPYSVAFRKGSAYLSTCSVCPGGGQVIRTSLS